MKKYILLFSLIGIFLFSACTGGGIEEESATQADSTVTLTEDYSEALSVEEQLIIGTLNLEETDLAVDEAQAQTLLPLWRALQSLENSETTAAAELTAVVNQIQSNMTPEQVQAIAAMELATDDIQSAIQNAGTAFGFRGGNAVGGDGDTAGGFGVQGGAPPEGFAVSPGGGGFGGPPGGGGFGGPGGGGVDGGSADPDALATRQAAFAEGDAQAQVGRFLITPLITLLEIRAGEREAPEPGEGGFLRGGFMGQVFEVITAETGLTIEEIQAQQAEGSSLAEIIEANGGDVEAVTAALEEAMADFELPEEQSLEELIDNILNGG
jgi:hypothetical protein